MKIRKNAKRIIIAIFFIFTFEFDEKGITQIIIAAIMQITPIGRSKGCRVSVIS